MAKTISIVILKKEIAQMIYGYVRVSTKQQNIDRQMQEKLAYGVNKTYIDKESGKDFDRTNYRKMLNRLKSDDLLVVKSIDRLGRNYQMILQEWATITKTIGADILVLDMPLLDTRSRDNDLVGTLIADIVLQVLSFVAENERTNIRQRQAEGIRIAKEKGVKFGRPRATTPTNTCQVINEYLLHELSAEEAYRAIGVSRGTFFKLVKEQKGAK